MTEADFHAQTTLLRQQTILAQFGELSLAAESVATIFAEGCRLLRVAITADFAEVLELQDTDAMVSDRTDAGWPSASAGSIPITARSGTATRYVVDTGKVLACADIQAQTQFTYSPALIGRGIRAAITVALAGAPNGRPIGILQAGKSEPYEFTQADVAFLRSYGGVMAAAVARLREIARSRGAQERLTLTLEAGRLGWLEVDLTSGAVAGTAATAAIFGTAGRVLAGWTFDNLLSQVVPEDRACLISILRSASEAGSDWQFECRIRHVRTGQLRWIEARGRVSGQTGAGLPAYLLGVVGDITDRKLAEAALRESNRNLRENLIDRTRTLAEVNALRLADAEELAPSGAPIPGLPGFRPGPQTHSAAAQDVSALVASLRDTLELIRRRAAEGGITELDGHVDAALSRATALGSHLVAFPQAAGPAAPVHDTAC